MGADGFLEPVVGAARQPHRRLGVHLLHARIGVRKHLHIDAGGIHLGDAALTDIVEAFGDPRRMLRVGTGIMPLYLGIEVMLLQRDDIRLRRHLSPPLTPVRVCGF